MSRRLLSIRLPRARQEAAPSAESSWITSALHLTPSLASIASLEGCEWPWIAVDSPSQPWKARYTLDGHGQWTSMIAMTTTALIFRSGKKESVRVSSKAGSGENKFARGFQSGAGQDASYSPSGFLFSLEANAIANLIIIVIAVTLTI